MFIKKSNIYLLFLGLFCLLPGCKEKEHKPVTHTKNVYVEKATYSAVKISRTFMGQVQPLHEEQVESEVPSPLTGQVSAHHAPVGQWVRAGQDLLSIHAGGKTHMIKAPVSGQLASLGAPVGETLQAGIPAATLVRDGNAEIWVDIPEDLATTLHETTATLTINGDPKNQFPLSLRQLSPTATPQTRTFLARYALSGDLAMPLKFGSSAPITITLRPKENGVILSATALMQSAGKFVVWIVNQQTNTLYLQEVIVLGYQQDTVCVQGIAEGALVIKAGTQKLDHTLRVIPIQDARVPEGSK